MVASPAKIILTPKMVPAAVEPQHQAISFGQGQMILSANPVTGNSAPSFYITHAAQPQTAQPVTCVTNNPAGGFTLNLQHTGKIQTPQLIPYNKSADQNNLNIAPKQLLLITAPGQPQKLRAFTTMGAGAGTHLNTPTPVTFSTTPVAASHPSITRQVPSTANIISMSSLAAMQTLQSAVPVAKPAIITGMLPTTAADGTVSYLPVHLTTRPSPSPIGRQVIQTSASEANIAPNTAFINNPGSAAGFTFVIPHNATHSGSNVQLISSPQTIQLAPAVPGNPSASSSSASKSPS